MRVAALGVLLALSLAACGGRSATSTTTADVPRTPQPAPAVELTAGDKEVWAPKPPDRSAIPVLLYHGIGEPADFANEDDAAYGIAAADFAKQMTLLHYGGYRTVSLTTFERFVAGEHVDLPAHPFLLTFDDALLNSWTGGDAILDELGYTTVLFADVARVESGDPHYLTMDELASLHAGGRWDVELHSGEGHQYVQYGLGPHAYGAYYAYEKRGETFGGWKNRALGDIAWGNDELAAHVPGYVHRAFAPPYGNYGQEGTNDDRIPGTLLDWLTSHFDLVFTQDVSHFATAKAPQPFGRIQITRAMTGGELHALLNP